MKNITLRLRTGVLAAVMACVGSAALATEFRSSDIHPEDYPTVLAVRHMGELVSKRTNGRHTIKVYAKSALGIEKDTIEQTKLGALAMTRVNSSAMNNVCQETTVVTMPFLFNSKEHMRHVLDGAVGDDILKACASQGFIGLAWYDSGARSIYTVKKPIKTLADAKGLKVRVQQSDLWVSLLEAMGANATPMPIGEVYTGLKTGLIDAAENNLPSFDGFKHFEAVKFYSHTEHSMAPEMLVISKAIFDKMSPADQALFRKAAKESVTFQRQKWDEQEAKALDIVVKAGSTIVKDVDKASFKAAMQPVYAKFITTPDLQRLVKAVQDNK